MIDSLIVALTPELKDYRIDILFPNGKDVAIYNDISKMIGNGWLVDRSMSIQLPFKSHVTEENLLPNFLELPKLSLLDAALHRCNELISYNKKIYLLWSGGIDSTMMLTSFILSNINPEQLVVVCNNDSIREYPKFYTDHIRGKFEVMSSELLMQSIKLTTVDNIILSGEQGDCMYGQDFGMMGSSLFGEEYLWQSPTKENILKLFMAKGMSDQAANCWYDLYSTSLKHSPREINTVYDFYWWTTFNWRWQWAVEKLKLRFKQDQQIHTFFSSNQLQKWSVDHKQQHILKLSDFKYEFKKLILDYTKDLSYFENKIKHPSATIYYSINSYAAMNQKRERILARNFSIKDYYLENNSITDWLSL